MKIQILCLTCIVLTNSLSFSQDAGQKSKVVAQIKGTTITQAELESAASGELMRLKLQRQEVLEKYLENLVVAKVVSLEAESRGVNQSQLLQSEVYGKVSDPSLEEINRFYEANKSRIKDPLEEAVPKIRQSLILQKRQALYQKYVEDLKAKYDVKTYLEPLRIEVGSDGHPSLGSSDAPVTIVEFSDFECPYCAKMNDALHMAYKEFGDKVRLVFRQMPLTQIHPNAMKAAEASLCAADQDKFWEMHDELFKSRGKASESELNKTAEALGLDLQTFNSCLSSGKHAGKIRADINEARAAGVSSTPTIFINGRLFKGALPYQSIVKVIREELERIRGQSP